MRLRYTVIMLPALLTAGCLMGPSYRRPSAPVPQAYKELMAKQAAAGVAWRTAQPNDSALRGKWWEAFGDAQLNALEDEVTISNQTVAAAEAQYRGARALVGGVRSSLFPSVGIGATVGRSSGVSTQSPGPGQAAPTATAYDVPVDLGWQIDLFGRIRRSVQASVAGAQASAADLEGVRLAMHSELALDYFLLRGLDAEIDLLNKTVAGYQTTVGLTENRFKQGVVSGVDVAQAKTQLDATRAQAIDLAISRAEFEHALAVLIGKPPAELSIAPAAIVFAPPDVPVGVPSDLLERRPDIAAAERRVAVANAQIGVAVAGYFPSLSLSGSAGYQGSKLAGLFSLPSRFWSLGASLFEALFDGGQRLAVKRQAVAAYDATVAGYRQTVLTALEQVEDNLAALRILAEEAQYQGGAVTQAELALKLANNRYMNGVTSYLEVVTAQTTALTNERLAVELLTRQMTASVGLIEALGGDWAVPKPGARATAMFGASAPAAARRPEK